MEEKGADGSGIAARAVQDASSAGRASTTEPRCIGAAQRRGGESPSRRGARERRARDGQAES